MDISMYVNTMKASGDADFRDISTVSIARPIESSRAPPPQDDSTNGKRDTSYLIAATMLIFVAIAASIGLFFCIVH
jgi:hypothetical protein